MEILVTGGAGYIGSHTVIQLIENGYTPIIVDNYSNSIPEILKRVQQIANTNITHYNIYCTNKQQFEQVFKNHKNLAGVIHFAAFKAVGESVAEPLNTTTTT